MDFKAFVFEGFDDLGYVFVAIGFYGDFEHNAVEAVFGFELVVIKADDVAAELADGFCHQKELAWCVWKLYAKGEDTAAGNKTGANHRGDGDHVDVATADDAAHLLVAAVEMLESCKW